MSINKTLVALVLVGAVGAGAVGAQPGNPRGNPDSGHGRGGAAQEMGRMWGRGAAREVIDAIIDATGLTAREVAQALRRGETLADLIAASGGDVDAVTADVTAALTARIEAALANGWIAQARADALIAEIEERVAAVINGEASPGGALRDRFPMRPRLNRMGLIDAAAEATGLTRGQILGQLIDGSTLSSIITASGGDVDAVITAAVERAAERLAQAVNNGRITQARADELLQRLTEMLQDAMNGTLRPSRNLS
jgi:hypothetical protein